MQDEVNEKTIALYIKTGKLTAQTLQKAMKAILSKGKKELSKPPQGKQSLKQLMKQNAGVSNIEITKDNIKAFESTAKKYGIDFALKKDTTETPPRYLVFFKGRDADALTAAFKEFSAKKLTQDMALMEDGSTEAAPPAVCSCTEKCEAGKVNVSCPVCKDNMTACSGKEAEPETEKPTEQPKEKGNTGGLVLFLVVALLGGGGAFYYFKFMKPKQNVKGDTDLEDFDFDDYDEDEGDGLSDEEQEDEEA